MKSIIGVGDRGIGGQGGAGRGQGGRQPPGQAGDRTSKLGGWQIRVEMVMSRRRRAARRGHRTCRRADARRGNDSGCATAFGEPKSDLSAVPEACVGAQEIKRHAAVYDTSMIPAEVGFCVFQEMQLQV